MSFQITHLRFAQKVQNIIKPRDLIRYFSGALYPDSRYITKLKKLKTHTRIEPKKFIKIDDDFVKGWQVHLWYDKLGICHLGQIALDRPYQQDDMLNPEVWVKVTGAKLVEDLFWWQNTDWAQILPYLKFINNPFHEDVSILQKWYQNIIDFYQNNAPGLEAYRQQTKFMGIEPERIELIMQAAYEFYKDQNKCRQIEKIMGEVYEEFLLML